jgi:predicted MFS family arabinose efflux permease
MNEKKLLLVLAAIQFTNILDFMIMMPLGPQLMRIFDISPAKFSALVSAYTFSAGVVGFAAAFFIDRFERKSMLKWVYAGFVLGTFACALSPGYGWLLASRVLTGAFGGMLGALVLSVVGDTIPLERRAAAMGKIMAAFSAASVLGVPFSLYIASITNWHAPFFILAIIGIGIWFGIRYYVPDLKYTPTLSGKPMRPMEIIRAVIEQRNLRIALLLMMVMMLGNFTITPFISPYMVANVGFSERELTYIYLAGGFITLFSSPWVGRLSDKYGPAKVFTVFVFISLLPIAIITNLQATPIPIVLLVTTTYFVVSGGRMIPAQTMITSAVRPEMRGSFMSLNSSVQQLATAAAAFIAGLIMVRNPDGTLSNYSYVGVLSMALCLLSILVARRVKAVS